MNAALSQLITGCQYLTTGKDVETSELFARQTGQHARFDVHALQFPVTIVYYRLIGALRLWEDQEGIAIALIGYPVADLDFSEETSLPNPNFQGRYFYGHALASELRARGRAVQCCIDHIRNCFPSVTHYFGYRGSRKMRAVRVRSTPCLVV